MIKPKEVFAVEGVYFTYHKQSSTVMKNKLEQNAFYGFLIINTANFKKT